MIPGPSVAAKENAVISIRDLKFAYEGGVQALTGVNLDIRRGEYVAIVGGNGSGKTTLAKNIIGLLKPGSGTILVHGVPASEQKIASRARVVGYAFQNPDHQLFCSSVTDEVRFGPRNQGCSERELEGRVHHALEAMNLMEVKDKPPLSLTLSARRRVSIASVIAMDPQVLILDEPTTGLDMRESDDLMASIGGLNIEGRTIILITHDMKLVAKYARRVVVMSEGKIVLDADPAGVFSDLDVLLRSKLVPPPVTRLAYRLSAVGVPREVLSPEELVFRLMVARGGAK
ncbi:MAG TPA: ATP-binding cassette domain-containing protein [Thermoplasmata archaeon]|nr:ATP-binding cassette domain-containing protein [Thermoplasmata archaeon]